MNFKINELAWDKMQGLLPAIVFDESKRTVLMLGYMNEEALIKTIECKWVTFYSRSKNQLWMKGETSNNKLQLISIATDCDKDTLLITANPLGPVCHTGLDTCFGHFKTNDWDVIQALEKTIIEREKTNPENSYTAQLFAQGLQRIAQKVGEESVEVVIAALNQNKDALANEVADLLYHLLVLLRAKNMELGTIISILKERMKPPSPSSHGEVA